ncbi:hypothetical protein L3X38_041392 [Prunus dulcis]|uniref:Uncharacterized protein n=1 Tax=Prunus dulcis TaxID=3755 RepID=A0AAD4YKK0_PRUDU|nr:hypothetical protein L3X38_041392 [Prunus dulcis]
MMLLTKLRPEKERGITAAVFQCLAPSYFWILLKSLIKTVILKRGAKILLPSLKTPPPQISAPQYFKGQ